MMHLPRWFLSLLLVLPLAAQQQKPVEWGVGTWNIEFLGAPAHLRRDTPPRTDEDLAAIGRFVRELGVAVLAVQEISGQAVLETVAKHAGPSWRALLGTTGAWDDGTTQQGIGFLYDDAVLELLWAEELLDLPREHEGTAVFHRKPVTACFRHRATGCDFRLVTVHLKAGQKPPDEHKRKLEATLLRAWLDERLADPDEDQDVLVLGDFNSGFGAEPESIFERGQFLRYLEPRQRRTTILHFDDTIDHIVATSSCSEVVAESLMVADRFGERDRTGWRKTYSDHYPVTVRLRAAGDDDPKSRFWRGSPEHVLPVAQRAAARPRPAVKPPTATPPATEQPTAWQPPAGTTIVIITSAEVMQGRLVHLDDTWVVLDHADGRRAVPVAQVQRLSW
jgi:endonuclease/exonuclease/phosphatase family metal-dependent hydrolase